MAIDLKNNVYCDGEGMPVVLVHGFPVDHRMWDKCAEELRKAAAKQGVKQFAIWAPDMPGAGEGPIPSDEDSGGKDADGAFPYGLDRMADAYVDLLHEAGYDKAIWVGLSMGGYLILDIQRLHPEAVAALALCDTKADADSAQMRVKRVAIAEECETTGTHEPVMGFAVPSDADSTVKRSEAYCRQFETWINEQPAAGIAWRERMAAGRPDLNDVLPEIDVPVAVCKRMQMRLYHLRRQGSIQPSGRDGTGRRRDGEGRRVDDGGRRLRTFQRIRASRPGGRGAAGTGAPGRMTSWHTSIARMSYEYRIYIARI